MVGMAKKKKIRVDLRKNRSKPPRQRHWTRGFQEHGFENEATPLDERVRAKGDLSRREAFGLQRVDYDGRPGRRIARGRNELRAELSNLGRV